MRQSMSKKFLEITAACCIVGVAAIWMFVTNAAMAGDDVEIKGGSPWGIDLIKESAKEYADSESSAVALSINRWTDGENIEQFCAGKCDILVHRAYPSGKEKILLQKRFGLGESKPGIFLVGHAKVAVIVHPANDIRGTSVLRLRALLTKIGKGMRWPMFAGSGGVVKCYGEGRDATSRLVIRHVCLSHGPYYPMGYHQYRDDFEQCSTAEEVVKKVQQQYDKLTAIVDEQREQAFLTIKHLESIQEYKPPPQDFTQSTLTSMETFLTDLKDRIAKQKQLAEGKKFFNVLKLRN